MKIKEKRLGFGHTVYVGKFKKFEVTIDKHSKGTWYFYLSREDLSYNSLWDGKKWIDIDSCVEAAEDWIKKNG